VAYLEWLKLVGSIFAIISLKKVAYLEWFDFYIYNIGKRYPIKRFSGGEIDLSKPSPVYRYLKDPGDVGNIRFLAFDEVFGS